MPGSHVAPCAAQFAAVSGRGCAGATASSGLRVVAPVRVPSVAVVLDSCAPVGLEQQAQQAVPPPEDAVASPLAATSLCGGSDFVFEMESAAQFAQAIQANAQRRLLQSAVAECASRLHSVALRSAPAREMVPFGRLVVQQSVQQHVVSTDVATAGNPAAGVSPGGSPAGTDAATTDTPP